LSLPLLPSPRHSGSQQRFSSSVGGKAIFLLSAVTVVLIDDVVVVFGDVVDVVVRKYCLGCEKQDETPYLI